MRVIGTAGHVDHGKSTLVQALTGTHPDRLKEEQEREMTIDLGFAFFRLPAGEEFPEGEDVGIVDVPGHRDFIENMLAGVAGIDAALFVVAADEGVMPQTREHLAILDILEVSGGVIALTKADLIDDAEWLELVEDDLRKVLAGTVLETAPIIRVSGRTGAGIPKLTQALSECLAQRSPRPDLGRPRLPVDRVFTIAGFGTVVTGTLSDGHLEVGKEVEILPQGIRGRIRGLQSHNQKRPTAIPGSRTAVNISGVDVAEVERGDLITYPGHYNPTRRLDVRFRLLPDVDLVVSHNLEVKLFLGAAEVLARVRLLGERQIEPGATGWLQLELRKPIVAVRGDRYILRRPSPGATLGGGRVVEPHPRGRHKRFSGETLRRLEALARGSPEEVLLQTIQSLGVSPVREAVARSSLEPRTAEEILPGLLAGGKVLVLEPKAVVAQADTLVTTATHWEQLSQKVRMQVERYHQQYPLRRGMQREEIRSRLRISPRVFNAAVQLLVQEGALEEAGPIVAIAGHQIQLSAQEQEAANRLMARFARSPYAPPTVKDCLTEVGEDVYEALVELGELIPVSPDVVFRAEDYETMMKRVREILQATGTITVAEFRDQFHTSRRYALAYLEHLDERNITIREGDVRRLR